MKVESAMTVEPVGEFELKGIRRPLAATMYSAPYPHRLEQPLTAKAAARDDENFMWVFIGGIDIADG
jgi:hypothetical protein